VAEVSGVDGNGAVVGTGVGRSPCWHADSSRAAANVARAAAVVACRGMVGALTIPDVAAQSADDASLETPHRVAYVRSTSYDTYMSKLTLSVDAAVVERAKAYAARRGTSVSRLVETYLGLLSEGPAGSDELPPITRRLSGILKGARVGRDDYRRHLERRYR
jgi:hypothetical protein